MFYRQEFGIDLGTDTIKIYDKKSDVITFEKNLIAVKEPQIILGAGDDAYEMLNRAPADTRIFTPAAGGRITDIKYTEAIIHLLLSGQKHYIGYKPSIYFAVPTNMTEIERRAYASIARRGKLKNCKVFLVEKPLLDALSMGLQITKAKGSVIINIGAFSTELSTIMDSNVILSVSVPIGGNRLDDEIISEVRKKNKLNISRSRAEKLKLEFMDIDFSQKGEIVEGIDCDSSLPRSGYVTRVTVERAVRHCLNLLLIELKTFFERIPPQIRNTSSLEGIFITGGGSHLPGLAKLFSLKLDLPINISSQYQYSTVNGLKEVILYSGANKLAFKPLSLKRI